MNFGPEKEISSGPGFIYMSAVYEQIVWLTPKLEFAEKIYKLIPKLELTVAIWNVICYNYPVKQFMGA